MANGAKHKVVKTAMLGSQNVDTVCQVLQLFDRAESSRAGYVGNAGLAVPAQSRLWFLAQLETDLSAYHIPAAVPRASGAVAG